MSKTVYLLLPAFLVVLGVGLIPTISLINYSVQTPFAEVEKFVGLENFRKVFVDTRVIDAFQRNIIFSALALAIEIPFGIGLALILYEKGKLNTLISMIITIPVLIPPITIGLLWRLMARENGTLRNLMNFLGLYYDPYRVPEQAFGTIVAMDVWHWTALICLVVSAGLAGMDKSPVLSAKTEGATRWQIFRHIELPALSFPLVFVSLLRLIDTLKIYDEATVLTMGGPGQTTEFLSLYVKKTAIDQFIVGYGAALSLIYNLTVLLLAWLLLIVMTKGKGVV
ncbi:MAG: sugar ABC transporter permease [Nitrososphaeria archaeon]